MTAKTMVGALVVAVMACACATPKRAVTYASARSGCPAEKIEIVQSDANSAVLDVCGEKQQWEHHPFNGYEYAGKAEAHDNTADAK